MLQRLKNYIGSRWLWSFRGIEFSVPRRVLYGGESVELNCKVLNESSRVGTVYIRFLIADAYYLDSPIFDSNRDLPVNEKRALRLLDIPPHLTRDAAVKFNILDSMGGRPFDVRFQIWNPHILYDGPHPWLFYDSGWKGGFEVVPESGPNTTLSVRILFDEKQAGIREWVDFLVEELRKYSIDASYGRRSRANESAKNRHRQAKANSVETILVICSSQYTMRLNEATSNDETGKPAELHTAAEYFREGHKLPILIVRNNDLPDDKKIPQVFSHANCIDMEGEQWAARPMLQLVDEIRKQSILDGVGINNLVAPASNPPGVDHVKLEELLEKLDASHLSFLCRCYKRPTTGARSDLIARLLDQGAPGIESVLFYKWPKSKLSDLAGKLGLSHRGTREEILDRILDPIVLPNNCQADYDFFELKNEVLILHKVDTRYLLSTYYRVNDLSDMCYDLGLAVSGAQSVLLERLLKSPEVTIDYILNDLKDDDLKHVAEDLQIERIPKLKQDKIKRILEQIGHRDAPDSKLPAAEALRATGKFKYDVAISYASEQKQVAEGIAKALRSKGLNVFYDGFEEASLWGANLAKRFAKIYSDEARYCIMLISAAYCSKVWPLFEQSNALSTHIQSHGDYILPIKLDDAWIEGLPKSTGYLNWSNVDADKVTELVQEKLRK